MSGLSRFLFLSPGIFLALAPLGEGGTLPWAASTARLVAAALAAWALLRPGARGLSVKAAGAWAFLLAWSGLSVLFTSFPHSTDAGVLNDLTSAALFFLGAAAGPADRRAMRVGAALGALAVVLWVLPASLARLAGSGEEVSGPLINANILASYALLTVPPAAALLWERRPWAGAAFLAAAGLVLTASGSRFAWAAAGVQVLAMSCLGRPKGRILVLAAAGLACAAGLWSLDADRAGWWLSAWGMARGTGFLGAGAGAFGEAYPFFRVAAEGQSTLFAHNFFLEALAERGLAGASALNGILFLVLSRAGSRFGGLPVLSRSIAVGAGGFLLNGLFNAGFSFPALAWVFWWAAGDLWGETETSPAVLRPPARTAGLVLSAAGAFFSFRIHWAGECLDRAALSLRKGNPAAAADAARRGLSWNRREPSLYSAAAAAAAAKGEWPEARAASQAAVALAPGSARFRAEAGEAAARMGLRQEALAHYGWAVRLLPLNKGYRARLEELRAAKD